jgi:hypothetical protein
VVSCAGPFEPKEYPMKIALSLAVLIALAPCTVLAAPNDPAPKDAAPTAAKDASTKDSSTKDTATKDAAKPKDCAKIKSTIVRQACLDLEAAEHSGQKSGNMGDAVDKMKREDDLLAKKLKSICRGC